MVAGDLPQLAGLGARSALEVIQGVAAELPGRQFRLESREGLVHVGAGALDLGADLLRAAPAGGWRGRVGHETFCFSHSLSSRKPCVVLRGTMLSPFSRSRAFLTSR